MYCAAPINEIYPPTIVIGDGAAEVEIEVNPQHFHTGGALHGSVYFKLLDDAAFFAANSQEQDVFVLTTSFTTYMTRPVSSGKIKAVGKVVNRNNSQWIAEAVMTNDESKEIARGNGIFVRSKTKLIDIPAYAELLNSQ